MYLDVFSSLLNTFALNLTFQLSNEFKKLKIRKKPESKKVFNENQEYPKEWFHKYQIKKFNATFVLYQEKSWRSKNCNILKSQDLSYMGKS